MQSLKRNQEQDCQEPDIKRDPNLSLLQSNVLRGVGERSQAWRNAAVADCDDQKKYSLIPNLFHQKGRGKGKKSIMTQGYIFKGRIRVYINQK